MERIAWPMLAAAVMAAAMTLGIPAAMAGSYGNAPWCAVQNLGAGDVVWDCEYDSAVACAPAVTAGNRGFCNVNPRWAPPLAAPLPHRARHHRRGWHVPAQ